MVNKTPAPEFQPPERRPRRLISPAAQERRFAYLDAIGRRCDADERRCRTGATVRFKIEPLCAGQPAGEPIEKQSCTRHRRLYEDSPDRYRVLETHQLPPDQQLHNRHERDASMGDR